MTSSMNSSLSANRSIDEPSSCSPEVQRCLAQLHAGLPIRASRYFHLKSVIDRLLAAALLVPALPLMGVLVALTRLTSPGPGIYAQVRVGRGGRNYTMFKLRSMRIDAEQGTGPVWAKQSDSRVTRLGFWLRKLHLDELPQLFNVLKGEMSLIGPRPERPEFVEILAREIQGYRTRLEVLPGITGLAQINLPADRDFDDVRRKIILDREYIETASLLLDIRVFLCTLLRIVGVRGTLAMQLMRLHRRVALPLVKVTPRDADSLGDLAASVTTTETVGPRAGETSKPVDEESGNPENFANSPATGDIHSTRWKAAMASADA